MGKEGCGSMDDNGERLTDVSIENGLVIGGSLFPYKTIHKLTWMSPNGWYENQIDHVMVNQKWRRSLFDVRAKRGADVGSDQHLLKAVLKLKLRRNDPQISPRQKRYNLHLLKDSKIRNDFTIEVRNRFQMLDNQYEIDAEANIEDQCCHIKEKYQAASESILGIKRRKQKEWTNPQTLGCIKQRRVLKSRISQTNSERQKGSCVLGMLNLIRW